MPVLYGKIKVEQSIYDALAVFMPLSEWKDVYSLICDCA